MENIDTEKSPIKNDSESCGCGDSCCAPKKKGPWMKLIFIIIMLAVATIITVKLIGKEDSSAMSGNDSISKTQSGCPDTAANKRCVKPCVDGEKQSCCPQTKD